MKIVVLAGGLSPERQVSLVSGQNICLALRELGHDAVLIDMFLGLENPDLPLHALFSAPDGLCGGYVIQAGEPDLEAVRRSRPGNSPSMFGPHVLELCALADIVFLGLHGESGEDGRIQAAFDLLGIPYTGAGHLASAMAMDKAVSKQVMERAGILTPSWQELTYREEEIPRLTDELPVPCAVKVVNGGSSLGMALPDTREELSAALRNTLRYGNHIIVEEKIRGRDFTVGVLGDRYLPAVEIVPQSGEYFDYVAKYQRDGSQEICPARITDEQWKTMGETALRLHRALGLEVYSRADFILGEDGRIWCLETNTLPGMTPGSLLPKEAAAIGMSYAGLCAEILELSLKKSEKGR
ncbi:MAG: D-alanine--D-alanine ligase [Oscillospiraceae bacterium]|nr:D-alanine--D-alanine ligase [Oscillospiraceae bacterium]